MWTGVFVWTGLAFLAMLGALPAAAQEQPIPYPHDKHIALGLACLDCHSRADTSDQATIPSIRKCLLCHEKVANEGPGVRTLLDFASKGLEAPWTRVYGFDQIAHVRFRHAPHVRAGVGCQSCHGDVAAMTVASKAVTHTMGTCLSCHRKNHADQDCAACHY